MPTPGVPILDPVNKAYMSPAEAGRGGAAIAQMGEGVEESAFDDLQLQAHIRKAQQHVDSLAAGNELNAAVEQAKVNLAEGTPVIRDKRNELCGRVPGEDTLAAPQWPERRRAH